MTNETKNDLEQKLSNPEKTAYRMVTTDDFGKISYHQMIDDESIVYANRYGQQMYLQFKSTKKGGNSSGEEVWRYIPKWGDGRYFYVREESCPTELETLEDNRLVSESQNLVRLSGNGFQPGTIYHDGRSCIASFDGEGLRKFARNIPHLNNYFERINSWMDLAQKRFDNKEK